MQCFECEFSYQLLHLETYSHLDCACRQERAVDGAFLGSDKLQQWTTGDVQKRTSRSLFVDLAVALLESADPKMLPQLIQCR